MMKRILLAILCVAVFPAALLAQTGKISGKVIDEKTGEALIGANVLIEGTDRGAATDINGNYVILNAPIGKLTLKATYIGYSPLTVRDVNVKSNETTRRDFSLVDETYKTDVIVVTAEKPIVDRQATNTKAVLSQEDIENLPGRGVEGVVALQAGAVQSGSGLNIRGSRADQTQFVVNGMNATDPTFGGRSISVIDNAVAEITYQAGGYSAEFGGKNAGIVNTTTRTGGSKLNANLEVFTDAWGDPSKQVLGTYPYGNTQYTLTVGGPVSIIDNNIKFFGALQWYDQNNPANRRKPLTLTEKYDALLRNTRAHAILDSAQQAKRGIFDPQLGTFAEKVDYTYPGGELIGYSLNQYIFNGNLSFNLNPINIRVDGTYGYTDQRGGSGVTTLNNQQRAGFAEAEDYSINLKLTHLLSQKTFYEVFLGFTGDYSVSMDNDHQHNLAAYGDSIENARYGYYWLADGIPPLSPSVFGVSFDTYGEPRSGYGKSRTQSVQGKINFVHQIGTTHEIKLGGDATRYTIRSYSAGNITTYYRYVRTNPDATAQQIAVNNQVSYYGYDAMGNELNDGVDGPKNPVFASFYALDKIELEDLVINFGLRYEYIDTKSKEFVDPNNIKFDANGMIREDQFKDVEASQTISPRVSFSFPVSDQTVFYAQYGQFVSQSRLRDVYLGYSVTSSNIQGGYAIGSPVGFGLKPERTTQYDFGFRQQIGDLLGIDLGAFYKDIKDQIQQRQIAAVTGAAHGAYYAWVNGDFTTSTGFNIRADLRRIERVTANVTYTYSDARGTGSNPSSAFFSLWLSPTGVPFLPKTTSPLTFDQNHTGAINVDYRFGRNDGPKFGDTYIFERLGLNMLFRFNSGQKYTMVNPEDFEDRRTPIESTNESSTPWVFYLDARLDKSVPIGPLNVNFYIWVINLLNTDNVEAVYATTGSWTSNGYLASEQGQKQIANYRQYGEVFADLYKDFYYQNNLMNAGVYGTPRQIRLGMRIDF